MKQTRTGFLLILATGIIFALTCQEFAPDFAPGLDASYMWGLNWLFVHDYGTLQQLVYPVGPLSFLKWPTTEGANLILALIFYLIVKCGFIVMGFKTVGLIGKDSPETGDNLFVRWFIPGVLLLAFSYFANIDVLIVFLCILLCLDSIRKQHLWSYAIASFLAILSLFIKISIGINAISVVVLSIPLYYYEHRDLKKAGWQAGTLFLSFVVLSFAILHHPSTIIKWYSGTMHLVFGYGSLALDYENHPVYLLLFAGTLIAAPFVCKDKYAKYACLLSALSLFAFYKHGFIREDNPHYFSMVYFMICFWMFLSLIETIRKPYILLLAFLSVTAIMMNAKEMDGFRQRSHKEFFGVANAAESYFHYHRLVRNSDEMTHANLQKMQLTDTLLQMIGNSTVDIYPFEFSYAAQNHLNWQPRTALGSALSPWIETLSAKNFDDSPDAARFILWHFQNDWLGKTSVSIDNRYFLNDEPQVVMNILNHYELAGREDHLILMKHTSTPALGSTTLSEPVTANWGEWIDVPQYEDGIVRVRALSEKKFTGKIIGTFYKDIIYTIEYKTSDGQCYPYRYDPTFASEGLWCNPFVQMPCDTLPEAGVVQIRFLASKPQQVKPTLSLQFEHTNTINRTLFTDK